MKAVASYVASLAGRQELQSSAVRAFGSVAAASGNPFLRFSNPFPAAIDHSPLLATLPETKVRLCLVLCSLLLEQLLTPWGARR